MIALFLALAPVLSSPADAHELHIGTIELAERSGGWVLSLAAPEAAFDRALCRSHGVVVVDAMDDRAWKEAVVDWVKHGVRIEADGAPLAFGAGGIRRGDHETRLQLSVTPPADPAALSVHADALVDDQVYVARLRSPQHDARTVLVRDNGWSSAWEG